VAKEEQHMPIIVCKCGFKLLWLPDVRVMGQAIEKHALEDKKNYGLTQEETEKLEDYLIAQALELADKKPKNR
jgi:hypothetical protein